MQAAFFEVQHALDAILRSEGEMIDALLEMHEAIDLAQPEHIDEMRALSRKFQIPLPHRWHKCVSGEDVDTYTLSTTQ